MPRLICDLAGAGRESITKLNDAVLLCCLRARLGSMAKRIETKWNRAGAGRSPIGQNLRHSGPKAAKIAVKGRAFR
jgi:hypothetical protein